MKSIYFKSALLVTPLLLSNVANAQLATVTVAPGDSLTQLAKEHLGDENLWLKLCNANRKIVGKNCNTIEPGMVLKLPGVKAAASETKPAASKEKTAEAAPAAKTTVAETSFSVDFSGESNAVFTGDEPLKASRAEGANAVTLSGNVEKASPGGKPGLSVAVSPGFEKAASGKKIKVTIDVTAKEDGTISAAYSTADVGNSGWQSLPVKAGENTVSFEYDVPAMKNGGGDYLGILPDPEGKGQSIDVTSVKFDVVS
ncbi:LysM peptidoglycan-binding domain-containing protein [Rhizobium sp. L1K21]|uniref:LysM peptidoglycan-binding domain-containing protein n=1 Tax=Rhizobium sp. L1K21 TaxID=2954933 RepID=UPI002093DE29|nr:LysM peptidoglycan-binding domain-containing protein [Rhizobium sp. L1K21]MCO6185536.1 LysM peptidoglycan-binding domain-containing protein [Rhizobium sp. L1K21]